MIYSGKAITVQAIHDGIAELCFDLQDDSVNKFNALTVGELKEATAAIAADSSLKGVIVKRRRDCGKDTQDQPGCIQCF
jgi:3-hydroxyacyl-CoA dehydrogenase/enoyl-CoA hydratase/3-hydroxybutyryl-CoA epimerase/enoyl-CoA isomerase